MADVQLPPIEKLEGIKFLEEESKQFWVYELSFKRPIDYRDQNSGAATLSLSYKLVCGLRAVATGRTNPAAEEKRAKALEPTEIRPDITESNIHRRLVEKVVLNGDEVNRNVLVFLCGGPGAANPTHRNPPLNEFYLKRGYWILFPDYRGTGDSTSVSSESSEWMANNFKYMRQTDIVRDLESFRQFLLGKSKWTILGQSFGGWISLTYLSFFWDGLENVTITAGLAPIDIDIKKHFEKIYEKIRDRNNVYYETYEDDKNKVKNLVKNLLTLAKENRSPRLDTLITENDENKTMLNTGYLTAKRVLSLGRTVLGRRAKFNLLHKLIGKLGSEIEKIRRGESGQLEDDTIRDFLELDGFRFWKRPLAAFLYESIFISREGESSDWSALELTGTMEQNNKFYWVNLEPDDMLKWTEDQTSVHFSGEMIYPCFFEDYDELKRLNNEGRHGNVADKVANYKWHEGLYDTKQLAKNQVPVRAVIYENDIFVDRELSEDTAKKVANLKYIVNKDLEHGSLNANAKDVLNLLYDPGLEWTESSATGSQRRS